MGYKVLVDELTVHRTIAKLVQADGSVVYQNGLGQTYYRDEVIPDETLRRTVREVLESGEGPLYESMSQKLEQSSDESGGQAARLGVPFAGYDEMEEDDVLTAMVEPALSRHRADQGVRGSSVTIRARGSSTTTSATASRPWTVRRERCQATCKTLTRTRRPPRSTPARFRRTGLLCLVRASPVPAIRRSRTERERRRRRATSRAPAPLAAVADVTASRSRQRDRRTHRWNEPTSSNTDDTRASWLANRSDCACGAG